MDKEAIAAQSLAAYISKHEIVTPMPGLLRKARYRKPTIQQIENRR